MVEFLPSKQAMRVRFPPPAPAFCLGSLPFRLGFDRMNSPRALIGLLLISGIASAAEVRLRESLTFHASFDGGTEADFARGDRRLYHAPAMNRRTNATAGLPSTNATVVLAKGEGRFGDALRFKTKSSATVFFQAATNLAYRGSNWSGTVSLWLSTDPAADLAPGFCDPIQITPRAWNDAAFFVEFEKRSNSIPFRLGAYADFKVWNPQNKKWELIPAAEKPLLAVEQPPFRRGQWTHVVFVFERYNTGRPDGMTRLYLNGEPQGMIPEREQTFTWEPARTHVMLGLSYVGLFDELSLFERALTSDEVAELHRLPDGVRGLLK